MIRSNISVKEQYGILCNVCDMALREYVNGSFYIPGVDFEKTRRYPYPFLRMLIAKDLYNIPGMSYKLVGDVMGKDHSTITYLVSSYYGEVGEQRDYRQLERLYNRCKKALEIEESKVFLGHGEREAKRILSAMKELGIKVYDEMLWHYENDDLSNIITQLQ